MSSSGELSSEAEAIAEELRTSLDRDGWSVRVERGPHRYVFSFEHPLSAGLRYVINDQQLPGARTSLASFMQDEQEFQIIKRAPKEPSNARLLAGFRAASLVYGWTPDHMRQIANVLIEVEAVSPDEADWLALHMVNQ